jgi:hypothetical protein
MSRYKKFLKSKFSISRFVAGHNKLMDDILGFDPPSQSSNNSEAVRLENNIQQISSTFSQIVPPFAANLFLSTAKLEVIDLISEGPIEGFVNERNETCTPLEGTYMDNTPIVESVAEEQNINVLRTDQMKGLFKDPTTGVKAILEEYKFRQLHQINQGFAGSSSDSHLYSTKTPIQSPVSLQPTVPSWCQTAGSKKSVLKHQVDVRVKFSIDPALNTTMADGDKSYGVTMAINPGVRADGDEIVPESQMNLSGVRAGMAAGMSIDSGRGYTSSPFAQQNFYGQDQMNDRSTGSSSFFTHQIPPTNNQYTYNRPLKYQGSHVFGGGLTKRGNVFESFTVRAFWNTVHGYAISTDGNERNNAAALFKECIRKPKLWNTSGIGQPYYLSEYYQFMPNAQDPEGLNEPIISGIEEAEGTLPGYIKSHINDDFNTGAFTNLTTNEQSELESHMTKESGKIDEIFCRKYMICDRYLTGIKCFTTAGSNTLANPGSGSSVEKSYYTDPDTLYGSPPGFATQFKSTNSNGQAHHLYAALGNKFRFNTNNGARYKISYSYFIPASNTNLDSLRGAISNERFHTGGRFATSIALADSSNVVPAAADIVTDTWTVHTGLFEANITNTDFPDGVTGAELLIMGSKASSSLSTWMNLGAVFDNQHFALRDLVVEQINESTPGKKIFPIPEVTGNYAYMVFDAQGHFATPGFTFSGDYKLDFLMGKTDSSDPRANLSQGVPIDIFRSNKNLLSYQFPEVTGYQLTYRNIEDSVCYEQHLGAYGSDTRVARLYSVTGCPIKFSNFDGIAGSDYDNLNLRESRFTEGFGVPSELNPINATKFRGAFLWPLYTGPLGVGMSGLVDGDTSRMIIASGDSESIKNAKILSGQTHNYDVLEEIGNLPVRTTGNYVQVPLTGERLLPGLWIKRYTKGVLNDYAVTGADIDIVGGLNLTPTNESNLFNRTVRIKETINHLQEVAPTLNLSQVALGHPSEYGDGTSASQGNLIDLYQKQWFEYDADARGKYNRTGTHSIVIDNNIPTNARGGTIEAFGYFRPKVNGVHSFKITAKRCAFWFWLGEYQDMTEPAPYPYLADAERTSANNGLMRGALNMDTGNAVIGNNDLATTSFSVTANKTLRSGIVYPMRVIVTHDGDTTRPNEEFKFEVKHPDRTVFITGLAENVFYTNPQLDEGKMMNPHLQHDITFDEFYANRYNNSIFNTGILEALVNSGSGFIDYDSVQTIDGVQSRSENDTRVKAIKYLNGDSSAIITGFASGHTITNAQFPGSNVSDGSAFQAGGSHVAVGPSNTYNYLQFIGQVYSTDLDQVVFTSGYKYANFANPDILASNTGQMVNNYLAVGVKQRSQETFNYNNIGVDVRLGEEDQEPISSESLVDHAVTKNLYGPLEDVDTTKSETGDYRAGTFDIDGGFSKARPLLQINTGDSTLIPDSLIYGSSAFSTSHRTFREITKDANRIGTTSTHIEISGSSTNSNNTAPLDYAGWLNNPPIATDSTHAVHVIKRREVDEIFLTFRILKLFSEQVFLADPASPDRSKDKLSLNIAITIGFEGIPDSVFTPIVHRATWEGIVTHPYATETESYTLPTYEEIIDNFPNDTLESLSEKHKRKVKIEKLDFENQSARIRRNVMLYSVTERVKHKFSYPHSALVKTQIDARTFADVPSRTFNLRLKKILVPSNYYPLDRNGKDVRFQDDVANIRDRLERNKKQGESDTSNIDGFNIYQGPWDGKFKLAWSDNPAWVLYDLLINPIYGLGSRLDDIADIDIFALYKIGRYCDAVDDNGNYVGIFDGAKGLEPRFSCNLYLDSAANAFERINDVASIFNGKVFYANGTIGVYSDKPEKPSSHFNNGNVYDGFFHYQTTAKSSNFNQVLVQYQDRKDDFRIQAEYVEDEEGMRKDGKLLRSIRAKGSTSRGQARRLARYVLYTNKLETEIVNFKADSVGLAVNVGDVISIADNLKQFDTTHTAFISTKDLDFNAFDVIVANILKSPTSDIPAGEANGVYKNVGFHVSSPNSSVYFLSKPRALSGGGETVGFVLYKPNSTTWQIVEVSSITGTNTASVDFQIVSSNVIVISTGNSNGQDPTDVGDNWTSVFGAVGGTPISVTKAGQDQHTILQESSIAENDDRIVLENQETNAFQNSPVYGFTNPILTEEPRVRFDIEKTFETGLYKTGEMVFYTPRAEISRQDMLDLIKTGGSIDNNILSGYDILQSINVDIESFTENQESYTVTIKSSSENNFDISGSESLTGLMSQIPSGSFASVSLRQDNLKTYRVTAVKPEENNLYAIQATEYNSGKFNFIDAPDEEYNLSRPEEPNIGIPTNPLKSTPQIYDFKVNTSPMNDTTRLATQAFDATDYETIDGRMSLNFTISGSIPKTEKSYNISAISANGQTFTATVPRSDTLATSPDPEVYVTQYKMYVPRSYGLYTFGVTANV